MRRALYTIATLAALLNPYPALAWKHFYNSACPTLNDKTSWKQYMTTNFSTSHSRGSMLSVHLNKARQVNDPAARGNLNPRFCYTVVFDQKTKKYWSYYTSPPDIKENGPNDKRNLPGDPNKNEINVYGVVLFFNDNGEVLDKKGNVIGDLVCYGSNECGRY